MAYVKNNWVDREGTTRYFEAVDADGAKIFTPDYTQVTELGTPVNADNMNHIEEGIEAGSFTKFNLTTTYAKDDLVTVIEDALPAIYKSLQDNNIGNALSDSAYWEKISLVGDRIEEQLANIEANKLSRADKQEIVAWGIPDYSAGIDIISSVSNGFTAPTQGFVTCSYAQGTSAVNCTVNDKKLTTWASSGNVYCSFYFILLDKDDVLKIGTQSLVRSANFFPLKGAK